MHLLQLQYISEKINNVSKISKMTQCTKLPRRVRGRVWPLWVLCAQSFPAFLQEVVSRTWTHDLKGNSFTAVPGLPFQNIKDVIVKKGLVYQTTLDLRRPPNICWMSVVSCELCSMCFSPPSPSKHAACIDITRCLVVFKLSYIINKIVYILNKEWIGLSNFKNSATVSFPSSL
jgi:hypothetical protein